MTKRSLELRAALPTDLFSNQQATKEAYRKMLKKVFDEMQSDQACQEAIWRWQTRFMHRRQAPQEILQPNSAEDAGVDMAGLQDFPMADEGSESEKSSERSEKSSESEQDKENPEDEPSEVEADFSKVKLSSKHAAFLRQTSHKKWILCYATQN